MSLQDSLLLCFDILLLNSLIISISFFNLLICNGLAIGVVGVAYDRPDRLLCAALHLFVM